MRRNGFGPLTSRTDRLKHYNVLIASRCVGVIFSSKALVGLLHVFAQHSSVKNNLLVCQDLLYDSLSGKYSSSQGAQKHTQHIFCLTAQAEA